MENMGYYEPDDCFICKNGRHLDLSSHYTSHAKDGTERKILSLIHISEPTRPY